MKEYDVVICDKETGEMVELVAESVGSELDAMARVEALEPYIDDEEFFVDMWIRYDAEKWEKQSGVWCLV